MPKVDDLYIEITSDSKKADKSLNDLVNTLSKVQASLRGFNSSGMSGLTNSVRNLSAAMVGLNNVGAKDYTRLAKGIRKIAELDSANITRAGASLVTLSKGLQQLDSIKVSDNSKQIAELASGISKLGYKSATNAIENIPKLATAMRELMATLSTAPKVSQNLINMTNALGNLARTGASSGRAANSLGKSLNFYSSTTGKATKKSFSLAGAIGKLYATYWLLFRAFGKLGDSINIASDLTEVQNVVDVTFGKYKSMVEDMAKTSITDFGMSELTVKQISSRFQAMGSAMGFAQGKMADMSIELTKLAADMASFYNVEQKDVAEDLESIFTGMTRPLRTYGLDLTEATLKEWAMKQGMDANIESMGQMEKTMLRYQYVMANTGAAQGDFLRTQDTFANQTRILRQNLEQLSIVVGRTFINALKPLVKYLNVAVQAITQFAQMVSDALGKIFGWKYEVGSGGITADIDDAAGGADDLAGGLGNAVDNAKKLRQQLHGIDELNVLTTDTAGKGSGSGSGTGTGAGAVSGGSWKQDADSMFKAYESEIDTLYQLGAKISETLSKTLSSIDWKSVYAKAQSFGVGLASFLNGLITPELFGNIGTTIANTLNTVLTAANTFAVVFDWKNLGTSLSQSVNDFFDTFDWKLAAETMNNLVDGLKEAIKGFFKGLTWDSILGGLGTFFGNLEFDTVGVIISAFAIKHSKEVLASKIGTALTTGLGTSSITLSNIALVIGVAAASFKAGTELGKLLFPEDTYYYDLPLTVMLSDVTLSFAEGTWKDAWNNLQKDGANEILVSLGFKDNAFKDLIDGIVDLNADLGELFLAGLNPGYGALKVKEWIQGIFKDPVWGNSDLGFADKLLIMLGFKKSPEVEVEVTPNEKSYKETDTKIKEWFANGYVTNVYTQAGDTEEKIKNVREALRSGLTKEGAILAKAGLLIPDKSDPDFVAKRQKLISNLGSIEATAAINKLNVAKTARTVENLKGKIIKTTLNSKAKNLSVTADVTKAKYEKLSDKYRTINGVKAKADIDIKDSKNQLENALNASPISVKVNMTPSITKKPPGMPTSDWLKYKANFPGFTAWENALGGVFKGGKWKRIAQYAGGGLPNYGSLFIAGEAGPEIVGHVGGQSEVLNQSQLASVMYNAVVGGNSETNALLARQNQLLQDVLQAVIDKETGINYKEVFKAAQKGASDYSSRTGRPAFA